MVASSEEVVVVLLFILSEEFPEVEFLVVGIGLRYYLLSLGLNYCRSTLAAAWLAFRRGTVHSASV